MRLSKGGLDRTCSYATAALLVGMAVSACAPMTRVTLLPSEQNPPSAVVVSTERGDTTLNTPYAVAEVGRGGRVSTARTSAETLRARHPELTALQPLKEERFTMTFDTGSAELTPEEQSRMETVIERARARPGGEILVTGHTDRMGSMVTNDRLALERAQVIRSLFIARGFPPERIEAVGRGEREPLVPTADEVTEPRNRRAEIVVR